MWLLTCASAGTADSSSALPCLAGAVSRTRPWSGVTSALRRGVVKRATIHCVKCLSATAGGDEVQYPVHAAAVARSWPIKAAVHHIRTAGFRSCSQCDRWQLSSSSCMHWLFAAAASSNRQLHMLLYQSNCCYAVWCCGELLGSPEHPHAA